MRAHPFPGVRPPPAGPPRPRPRPRLPSAHRRLVQPTSVPAQMTVHLSGSSACQSLLGRQDLPPHLAVGRRLATPGDTTHLCGTPVSPRWDSPVKTGCDFCALLRRPHSALCPWTFVSDRGRLRRPGQGTALRAFRGSSEGPRRRGRGPGAPAPRRGVALCAFAPGGVRPPQRGSTGECGSSEPRSRAPASPRETHARERSAVCSFASDRWGEAERPCTAAALRALGVQSAVETQAGFSRPRAVRVLGVTPSSTRVGARRWGERRRGRRTLQSRGTPATAAGHRAPGGLPQRGGRALARGRTSYSDSVPRRLKGQTPSRTRRLGRHLPSGR